MKKLQSAGFTALFAAIIVFTCPRPLAAQVQSTDPNYDPAAANMAPDDGSDSAAPASEGIVQSSAPINQPVNEAITAAQSAQPAASDQAVNQGLDALDEASAGYDDAAAQTNQAPPPLPDYMQPPLPAPGYIWTPGYWAWSADGYFWVPGAWVLPPYVGALWTPGYWAFHKHEYLFYRGYWGPYIGYYGGINYGFGYVGRGYEGGYWSGSEFFYNRSVNNVRFNLRTVYTHPVNVAVNHFSFNGSGGERQRPVAAELAAMRRPRYAPMSAQIQAHQAAAQDRRQFVTPENSRPAAFANERPIMPDERVQPLPPARVPQSNPVPEVQQYRRAQPLQTYPQPQRNNPQQISAPQNFARPAAPQPEQRAPQNFARPSPQPRPRSAPEQRQDEHHQH